ncbi:MAG: DUF3991 domain-containing protein [Ruminococcaceae bacterium]|nr:DUF3991 domain-containing protein [Oscillospiraceae bacterium]
MDLLQAIKQDIRITEFAQSRGFTLLRAGSEVTLKEHDSVRIDPEKNLFVRNADRKTAGSIIDFVMWVDGVNMPQAVSKLRGMLTYGPDYQPRPRAAYRKPKKELRLPEAATGKYSRVYAYLNKTRCIDNEVIAGLMKRRLLYEDDHHNCVFVGLDYNGAPAFATKRSTSTRVSYRGDAPGSRKEVGFFVDNKAPALFVTEAPIDAMSIMTLLRENKRDPTNYSYLSLCGVADNALLYHMQKPENQGIQTIYLATDNDAAGNLAREQLRKALTGIGFNGKIVDKCPTVGKDWNEQLVGFRNPALLREQKQAVKPQLQPASEQQTFERGMDI